MERRTSSRSGSQTQGVPQPLELAPSTSQDAFQAFVAGELVDRMLVGDGQPLTMQIGEAFAKVDARLRVSTH